MLEIDACNMQIGCVVVYKQPDETTKLVGYWTHSLTNAKKLYDTTQRDGLATPRAVLFFRPYLEAHWFIIRSNHDALKWILNLANSTG